MQTIQSQWEREPLQVPDECPTVALRHIVGMQSVWSDDSDIATLVRERVEGMRAKGTAEEGWTDEAVEDAVRAALWFHAENRAVCTAYRM